MKNKYFVVAEDGTRFTRNSPRTYTHCVLVQFANGDAARAEIARLESGKLNQNETQDMRHIRKYYQNLSDADFRAKKIADYIDFFKQRASYADDRAGKFGLAGFCGSLVLAEKLAGQTRSKWHLDCMKVAVLPVEVAK